MINKGDYEITLIGWNRKSHSFYSVKKINNEKNKSKIMQTKSQLANYYLLFFPFFFTFIIN